MSRRTRVVAGVAAVAVLVAAVVVVAEVVAGNASGPHVGVAAARRSTPAIEAYLPTHAAGTWDGPLAQRHPGQARWFCRADPIESRRSSDGRLWVGVLAQCGEYLRTGERLTIDAGYASPLVVVLRPQGSVDVPIQAYHPSDGGRFAWSLRQMFTPAGARTALRGTADGDFPDPAPAARRAFGLPAQAPIVQG